MLSWAQMIPETVSPNARLPLRISLPVYPELPSAFHKQSRNVDVTEIQLQFTWQLDAASAHMTTH